MSNRKHSFIDRVRAFIWRNWQGEVLIGPQDPVPPSSLALVTREYLRDCSERGRGPHIEGEDLARAAAVYASPDRLVVEHTGMSPWPWPERCDEINQLTRVEQLTRAAVLCMREIDRLREGGADHLAGAGKMVETEPNGHLSDADLVERAVRNAGYLITDGEVPRWAAVRDTFAVGSSSAFHLCRRFGLDPDAMVGCFVEAEEEEREHIGLSSDVCESCGRVSCSFECPERTAIEKESKEGGGEPAQFTHGHDVTPPPVGKAGGEEFRPGLPPLELRRVWREWEDHEGSIAYFTKDGQGFRWGFCPSEHDPGWRSLDADWRLKPRGVTWQHVESLAAAKVADKQPWERELADAEAALAAGALSNEKTSAFLFEARKLDALRRVVESGQGSAEVPRAIIDRYPLADGKPRGEGCWMCCKSERLPEFEVFCDRGNFRDVFWTFGTTLNAFIHAAGNEMVAK